MAVSVRCWIVGAVSTLSLAQFTWAADLASTNVVLERIGKGLAPTPTGLSEPAKLLNDINAFRSRSASLAVDRAAADWLILWDRAQSLDSESLAADYAAFDVETGTPVGLRSVIAALPAPPVWPTIRQQVVARSQLKPDDVPTLGVRFILELLTGDKTAFLGTLTHFDRAITLTSPGERELKRTALNNTRAMVYKLYGSRVQIADSFMSSVDAQAKLGYDLPVDVPDLVGLVGEAKATALLNQALQKPVSLRVMEGEATRALARKLALKKIAVLRKPQWGLIDSIGATKLYEALRDRFDAVAKKSTHSAPDEAGSDFDFVRQQADTYYFLDLVIAGRHEEASRAMVRAAGGYSGLNVPRDAMTALVRGGKNEALYTFLAKVLEKRPQLQAWDTYLEQAAYLGHAKDPIVLIDKILKRPDLPPYLRAELQGNRLDALLGADEVDAALAGFNELLSPPPTKEEVKLNDRVNAAIRLAALGRILKQPTLSKTGFDFAQRALALPATPSSYWRIKALREVLAEQRRQGHAAEAQALALAEIEREGSPQAGGAALAAFVVEPIKRAALIELAGIYDEAGRSGDVLRLLNEVGFWGVRDVQAIVAEQDSLGTPLGLMAARALKASGNGPTAEAILRALINRMPGYDPAYQLFVELTVSQAPAELDRLYALDQFEERPLIWKAITLSATGQNAEAEKTVRQAIAIDPSDGEQGANDRMRAYATLADILEATGDANGAKGYRNAVAAIRLSEEADGLHKVGLYQRAFAGYRAALDEFSDAYCIQSRLAVQLGKQGQHTEALKHYRRAYELMPDSFGRIESHCFGCESVFADSNAQAVAERVFTSLVQRASPKPQAYYLLGYLRQEQGRYEEALGLFRQAVTVDSQYLNAWKHLHELGEKTYIDASERDIARLKLFELDPQQRHVQYQLNEVADFNALWPIFQQKAAARELARNAPPVFPLAGSIREQSESLEKLPQDMRAQMQRYIDLQIVAQMQSSNATATMAKHKLIISVLNLMGDRTPSDMSD